MLINYKKKHRYEYYNFYRNFFDYWSDPASYPEPDPLLPEGDPRIHIKMKRIRNTEENDLHTIYLSI